MNIVNRLLLIGGLIYFAMMQRKKALETTLSLLLVCLQYV